MLTAYPSVSDTSIRVVKLRQRVRASFSSLLFPSKGENIQWFVRARSSADVARTFHSDIDRCPMGPARRWEGRLGSARVAGRRKDVTLPPKTFLPLQLNFLQFFFLSYFLSRDLRFLLHASHLLRFRLRLRLRLRLFPWRSSTRLVLALVSDSRRPPPQSHRPPAGGRRPRSRSRAAPGSPLLTGRCS